MNVVSRASAPWVVALTGGVASGKSTVAEHFSARGVPVLDADEAARAVVAPGSAGLRAVVRAFGADVLDAEGRLDRRRLRKQVFADPAARARLEAIIHPRVRTALRQGVRAQSAPWLVLAIPLLAETWPQYAWVDRVLVVDVPEAVQLERLMRRDGVTRALAAQMLAAQAGRERRLALADDLLRNDAAPETLGPQVARLAATYARLARAAAWPRLQRGSGRVPPERV